MDRVSVVEALLRDGLSGIALPWEKTTQRFVKVGNVEDPVLSPYSIHREGDSVYAVCAYGKWGVETKEVWEPAGEVTENCNLVFILIILGGDNLRVIHVGGNTSEVLLPEESGRERKFFLTTDTRGECHLYTREGDFLGTTQNPTHAGRLRLVQSNCNGLPILEYIEDGEDCWEPAPEFFIRDEE